MVKVNKEQKEKQEQRHGGRDNSQVKPSPSYLDVVDESNDGSKYPAYLLLEV
jgi:delta-aminolevulinic acid dehydratase/porphobilinogen synthase